MTPQKKQNFRYDINGLRAYAVSFVVLFHFGVLSAATGLFIGVDIFFVISGFLMTKIIVSQLQQQQFSLFQFFLARAIRILPALLVLTAVIGVVGWYVLIPEEYRSYAKHAALSIVFLSNVEYFREAGDYFAANTHDKILLHTWSLSVEWQFYMLLPIVLALVAKFNRSLSSFKVVIVLGFVISLLLSVFLSSQHRIFSFFMLPTRAWEMLAGGMVYLFFSQLSLSVLQQKLLEYTGFVCILISAFIFSPESIWPGYAALLPVVGTMLILIANRQDSWLTRPKILQFLGNSSYSIYLWHWPIVFFIGYFALDKSFTIISLGIALSVLLGWLSYKWVETPIAKPLLKLNLSKGYAVFTLAIACLFISYAGIFKMAGVPSRASPEYIAMTKTLKMPLPEDGYCFYSVDSIPSLQVGTDGLKCQIGSQDSTAKRAILFGDSYAGHNLPFWNTIGQKMNLNIHSITTNWCYPSFAENYSGPKLSRAYQQCLINRDYFQKNVHHYDVVILAGSWLAVMSNNHQQDFSDLISHLKSLDKKVVVMAAPYTFNKHVGNSYKRALWVGQDFNLEGDMSNIQQQRLQQAHQKIEQLLAPYPSMLFLKQPDLFAASQLDTQGAPYSLDGGHLTIAGSLASADYFSHSERFQSFHDFIGK